MAKDQRIPRGDQAQHTPHGNDLDRAVSERNISPARPASEAEKMAQEREGRARTARRERDKLGDPARQQDER
jgi:hypothetical protein